MKLDRRNTSQSIGGLNIHTYFKGSNNFRQTVKDKASVTFKDSKNENNDFMLRLKDGIEGIFAKNAFELFDLTPNLPLYEFFGDGQVPTRYGGGFVEQVSAIRINYTLPETRLTGTKTNEREAAEIIEEKLTVPAYAFQYLATVTEYEAMKYSHINYDIYGYRVEAMRLAYQRELEYFKFLGNLGVSNIDATHKDFVPGLLNQGNDVAINEFYGSDWTTDFSVEGFITSILGALNKVIVNVRHQKSRYPNTLLVGSDMFEILLQPAVVGNVAQSGGAGIALSILEYVERQIRIRTGQPFLILENPYLNADATEDTTTAGIVANGANGNGMMVLYRNDDQVMRNHIPMPLTGGSMFLTAAGWQQNFIAIATPTLVIYPTIAYIHNGAAE